jgi:beta-galactosidase
LNVGRETRIRFVPMSARRNAVLAVVAVIAAAVSLCSASPRQEPGSAAHSVVAGPTSILIDGKPVQIISGEMHYARVPREYWRDRLRKAKAMGLNAITTYVFWNLHEPRPGVFDFSGQNDVAEYIREAQQEGLYVILRPGPYVCSEWDLGGLPAWLLADPDIVLRSRDPKFLSAAERYMMRLGQELAPLQYTRGGPIIAVQVENEYGSFDSDHEYMAAIRDMIKKAGLGEVMLYTADGPEQLTAGTLPDLPAVVNFGPGDAPDAFAALHKFRPNQFLMSGEYWAGWFDAWGHKHEHTDAEQQAKEFDWMLSQGASVSIYMFHGGTTFGFMNGANWTREGYSPQTTSYDYDSALDESGRPTKKYFMFRDVIAKHSLAGAPSLPDVPQSQPTIAIPEFRLVPDAGSFEGFPPPVTSDQPRTMETLGQEYGYVLYRTTIIGPIDATLKIDGLQDYAAISLDGQRIAELDRRLNQNEAPVHVADRSAQLDILVENTGRINFGKQLRGERKGIAGPVTLDDRAVTGWQIFAIPPATLSGLHFADPPESNPSRGPWTYRGSFQLTATGDTFLDMRGWHKGVVLLNSHWLGRFWDIGPQQTLYVPAQWLIRGTNWVTVFELGGNPPRTLRGLKEPILDEVHPPSPIAH